MAMLTPQQVLDKLQQAAGRTLTPQEIEQAKGMLPAGWQQGVDDSTLAPLINKALQLRPDWAPQPPPDVYDGKPGPTEGTIPPGGTGGGSGAPGGFQFPQFTPPADPRLTNFTPGSYSAPIYQPIAPFKAPPPFQFDPYTQPTLEEAQKEPGFDLAMKEGLQAMGNNSAAKGVYRTGGNLKDLFTWANKAGEQNYSNVNNRKFQTWGANRDNAAGAYALNYGVGKDTFSLNEKQTADAFDRNALGGLTAFQTNLGAQERANTSNNNNALDLFDRQNQGAIAAFNPKFEGAKITFEDLYRRWKAGLDATTNIAVAGAS